MRPSLLILAAMLLTARAADQKPVFLYSLYFNAPGENRYPADGAYKELLSRLAQDFEVRINDKPLTAAHLQDVSVVLVANPNDKPARNNPPPHHVDDSDIREITRFVQNGGGFIVLGNQENHNLEIADSNKLLAHFGIQFTNLYTDAKKLVLPSNTPLIGGLRWAYYTGNLLLLDTNNPAHPRSLATNDLHQKPEKGPRDQPGVLMASATPGKGHVLVVTDAGWLANWAFDEQGVGGVAIKGQDNWEIFHRLALSCLAQQP